MDILRQFLTGWLLTPTGFLTFLFYITLVVFVHEMGHFLMARFFGAKVDVFSVGFGREIVGFTDRRGTRWRFSALPLGGYVQFAGDMNPASQPSEDWLALPEEERAKTFQAKPLWQRALLVAAGPVPGGRLPLRVTYDAPCHLHHAQRITDAPLAILRAIPGLDLVALPDADRCCGGAGIYNLTEPDTAAKVLDPKLEYVRATGASLVVTGNPGCHMQIGAGLIRSGSRVRCVHPVDLLDRSYNDHHG